MWSYNLDVDPPAPFIEIVLRHPTNPEQTTYLQAKIDTGADISAIPADLLAQIPLPTASKIIVEGYDGVSATVFSYSTHLEIAGTRFENWEVIEIPDSYGLLGRDLLNHFYIQLNGPELTLSLSRTRP